MGLILALMLVFWAPVAATAQGFTNFASLVGIAFNPDRPIVSDTNGRVGLAAAWEGGSTTDVARFQSMFEATALAPVAPAQGQEEALLRHLGAGDGLMVAPVPRGLAPFDDGARAAALARLAAVPGLSGGEQGWRYGGQPAQLRVVVQELALGALGYVDGISRGTDPVFPDATAARVAVTQAVQQMMRNFGSLGFVATPIILKTDDFNATIASGQYDIAVFYAPKAPMSLGETAAFLRAVGLGPKPTGGVGAFLSGLLTAPGQVDRWDRMRAVDRVMFNTALIVPMFWIKQRDPLNSAKRDFDEGTNSGFLAARKTYESLCDRDHANACLWAGSLWADYVNIGQRSALRSGRLFRKSCDLGASAGCQMLAQRTAAINTAQWQRQELMGARFISRNRNDTITPGPGSDRVQTAVGHWSLMTKGTGVSPDMEARIASAMPTPTRVWADLVFSCGDTTLDWIALTVDRKIVRSRRMFLLIEGDYAMTEVFQDISTLVFEIDGMTYPMSFDAPSFRINDEPEALVEWHLRAPRDNRFTMQQIWGAFRNARSVTLVLDGRMRMPFSTVGSGQAIERLEQFYRQSGPFVPCS